MPVVKVNKENSKLFNKAVKSNKFIIVYLMDNCGHCIDLKPKLNEAIKKHGNESLIAEIEYHDIKYLDNNNLKSIEGFPTIKVFNNGKEIDEFREQRNVDSISKFLKKNKSAKLPK
jgi:thiol-disulfide isomerase/thioredoxin